MRVIAVVPAHNEEALIAETVRSLRDQTRPPDEVYVVADNCTDNTAAVAQEHGATVIETVGNRHKKAGALNQALSALVPTMEHDDCVLVMDADSVLVEDWVENAVPYALENGTVSGAYEAAEYPGWLPLLQKVEYAQERRKIARKKGRVNVLSGAASLFQVEVLRVIAYARGDYLPGEHGEFYSSGSLTEDFEITLAAQRLGFTPISPARLRVVTDVMCTVRELFGQRVRWQRGYLETLAQYPLRVTWRAWLVQSYVYAGSTLPLLCGAMVLTSWKLFGFNVVPEWLAVIPIFALSEAVAAKRAGRRGVVLAALLFPLAIYNLFRGVVYWRALWMTATASKRAWT